MAVTGYDRSQWLPTRFVYHAIYGIKSLSETDHHQADKNFIEKMGDAGLWFIEKFPGKMGRVVKDPRIVTLALTALALYGNSYLFYPEKTMELTARYLMRLMFHIPDWAPKFACYISINGLIISLALRAEGRFINPIFVKNFFPSRSDV